MNKLYTIIGYMNSGSATLTYPEDFDGPNDVWDDKEECEKECERLQREAFKCYEIKCKKGEDVQDVLSMLEDNYCMVFEVCVLKFHHKK